MADLLTEATIRTRVPVRAIIQLTDIDEQGEVNDTVLGAQMDAAEAFASRYITKRRTWASLVASAPSTAVELLFGLWWWTAHRDRNSVTEDMQRDHDADVEWLVDYTKGKVSFGDDDDPTQPAGGDFEANDRVWTRDDLESW